MAKVFYGVLLLIAVAVAAFFLHIPALKYLTRPGTSSDFASYTRLADVIEGDAYRIEKVFYGHVLDIRYDARNEQYHLVANFVEPQPGDYADKYVVTLNRQGDHLNTQGVSQEELEAILENPDFVSVPMSTERRYFPEYSFSEMVGSID